MTEFRPLYARVRAQLVRRLSAGDWLPGVAIPSETALAAEFGVSQGTVRRAVGQLVDEGALRRAQGRGTFVAEQTPERANFRFFRLVDNAGNRVVPALVRQIAGVKPADAAQAAALELDGGEPVQIVVRLRAIAGRRAIDETVAVPEAVMPGLVIGPALPNALYPHYQARFGVSVLNTSERLSATAATARQARRLEVARGAPLLRVERTAHDLTGRAVEHRVSYFVTTDLAFSVALR